MTSLSGLIKGILLAVLTAMMLLLVALALVSLARMGGGGADDTIGTVPPAPSEPLTSVPLGPTGTEGSVLCFRPEGGDPSFLVQLTSPGPDVEPYVIAVALVGPDGSRDGRTVTLPQAEPGVETRGLVADSADTERFVECTVTAIQSDKRVILTGQ